MSEQEKRQAERFEYRMRVSSSSNRHGQFMTLGADREERMQSIRILLF